MSATANRTLRVLVVDDDATSVALISRPLTNAGYEVVTAASGEDALRALVSDEIQIVVTDWMMPGMTGLDLCRAIRMHEGIPFAHVVVVTARTGEDQLLQAFEAGADDYLVKPLSHRELLARIRAGERILTLQQDLEARQREVHRINAEMAIAQQKLADANERLNLLATTDELTGLLNRREAMARLDEYWASSTRSSAPLAVISLDLDHFKSFNDVHGHAIGDAVLRTTAATLRKTCRKDEFPCRIGGEEFLILCPRAAEEEAAVAAERIRASIEAATVVVNGLALSITLSIGVAEREPGMNGPNDLLHAADEALYAAKDAGRNRVCRASGFLVADGDEPVKRTLTKGGASNEASRAQDWQKANILLADGDATSRTACSTALERAGHTVDAIADSTQAVEKCKCGAYDVIILAAKLHDSSGVSCISAIRSAMANRDVPIIFAAGRRDSVDASACVEAGADEYVRKPIDHKELLVRVASMMRLRHHVTETVLR